MRIAWTGPVGDTGGVPGMGLLMLRELLGQGVEVDLYLSTDRTTPLPIEPMPGLRIIVRRARWQWGRWYSRKKATAMFTGLAARSLNNVILSLRLLAEHRRAPYDAVFQLSTPELFLLGRVGRLAPPIVVHPCSHAAGELRWHTAERAYALRSERRSVHYLMGAWLAIRSRVQARELANADLVIGPSGRFVDLLHEDYGVPREKLRVLRHPVDLERFSPSGPEERFSPSGSERPAHPRTLLFISRISSRKGVAEIVELSHRLADLAGSVRLTVVGGATLWSDYRASLADLDSRVAEYVGPKSMEQIVRLMRSSTMLVVPSRYEPGSIVTGEALGCGLPVVLSDQVGPSEVVQGPHMRIHRAGDVDELECAVRSLLDAVEADEPALRNGARANAEREFGAHVVISQLVRIVRSLSGGSIDAATGSGGADERAEAAASPADDDDALVPA